MPLDATPAELNDLRRRAGISPVTPAYEKLNPPPITVKLNRADLLTIIAALEQLVGAQETVPGKQVLAKLMAIHRPQPEPTPATHDPLDPNNPFYQAALMKAYGG